MTAEVKAEPAPRLWNKPNLRLDEIVVDHDLQSRAELSEEVIEQYAAAMRDPTSGEWFPALNVFYDPIEKIYRLADGFHRYHAYQRAEWKTAVRVHVLEGSKREARIHAAGANITHGLNRTNADKRRAVEMLLTDDEWRQKSDRAVADYCKVSNHLVAEVRAATGNSPSSEEKRVGKDGKAQGAEAKESRAGR